MYLALLYSLKSPSLVPRVFLRNDKKQKIKSLLVVVN